MQKLLALILVAAPLYCNNWQKLIDDHDYMMSPAAQKLLTAQNQAYQNNKVPKIADPCIKDIPIKESGERLSEIPDATELLSAHLGAWQHINHPRIFMMAKPLAPYMSPDCNAGWNASRKVRTSIYERLSQMVNQLDFWGTSFGYETGSLCIAVFEGLRCLSDQKKIFEDKAAEIRKEQPNLNDQQIYDETCKFVSPVANNVPVHSTGGAVDIRLWDRARNKFVDMGQFGVIWGNNPVTSTFNNDISEKQKMNRLLMLIAATKAGLTNYPYEWWHFSHGDRYACYWRTEKPAERIAQYGPVL